MCKSSKCAKLDYMKQATAPFPDPVKKWIVRGLYGVTWPLAWPARTLYHRWRNCRGFSFGARLLSIVPGRVGQYLRAAYYMQTLERCCHDVSVGFLSFFAHPACSVGQRVYIGSLCTIGRSTLEDGALIASRVSVNAEVTPMQVPQPIRIGRASWLGESAIVQADVGAQAIVGAGCVVTQAVADCTTVAGNPAKRIA